MLKNRCAGPRCCKYWLKPDTLVSAYELLYLHCKSKNKKSTFCHCVAIFRKKTNKNEQSDVFHFEVLGLKKYDQNPILKKYIVIINSANNFVSFFMVRKHI